MNDIYYYYYYLYKIAPALLPSAVREGEGIWEDTDGGAELQLTAGLPSLTRGEVVVESHVEGQISPVLQGLLVSHPSIVSSLLQGLGPPV